MYNNFSFERNYPRYTKAVIVTVHNEMYGEFSFTRELDWFEKFTDEVVERLSFELALNAPEWGNEFTSMVVVKDGCNTIVEVSREDWEYDREMYETWESEYCYSR